jgi:hypothetical protein
MVSEKRKRCFPPVKHISWIPEMLLTTYSLFSKVQKNSAKFSIVSIVYLSYLINWSTALPCFIFDIVLILFSPISLSSKPGFPLRESRRWGLVRNINSHLPPISTVWRGA